MKTLVLANQKGGVGKSAVATLLAHYFAQHGSSVLAIDFDHQGNFSKPLRASGRASVASVSADKLLANAPTPLHAQPFTLVPSDFQLLMLERQGSSHNLFAQHFRAFLKAMDAAFDVCIIDTNPNPDIRVISALASADFVLSPIQLNQEALFGVGAFLNHERVGVRKITALLNPKLTLVGLLPTQVESTPFQRANLVQVVERHHELLIPLSERPGHVAFLPKRSAIAEAQADGVVLWEMKKTAARDAWKEIEPGIARIAAIVTNRSNAHAAA